ncbi:MAG: Flp family type IVb pilin [Gammaproteobacteria bacterium]|nr:Flp family type IVb pilin [Gammaproteobacteria bacterium]
MSIVIKVIKQFFNDESGANVAEYAILAALIAVAVIATVTLIGVALDNKFGEFKDCIVNSGC